MMLEPDNVIRGSPDKVVMFVTAGGIGGGGGGVGGIIGDVDAPVRIGPHSARNRRFPGGGVGGGFT